jgi:hypothetical protein
MITTRAATVSSASYEAIFLGQSIIYMITGKTQITTTHSARRTTMERSVLSWVPFCMRTAHHLDKLVCFESKPPIWNNDVGAHVLYFNGKATMASVKNFQLCTQNDEQRIIMQFGRIDKDEFSLEVQWPMSLFQAFAVALSSFDSKLGCD